MKKRSFMISAVALSGFLFLAGLFVLAQKPEQFQTQAFGTGTQVGRKAGVTIIINAYSTPEDQKLLIDAFARAGNKGLSKAVSKMPVKGRIAVTGGVGYDVTYIRVFQTPTGRKIRLVANRPIELGEVWSASRSLDYNLSAIELEVDANGKGTGTLLPACQLKMNKQNEIEIEAYQNPWRLADVFPWK